MDRTVADVVVERLRRWDVRRVFGYSGDGINGLLAALRRAGGEPRFVQARHEQAAAFMATAHAKYTGGLAVCASTQGPGAVNLLNGLYDAKLDHTPVLAIVGQQSRSVLGSAYQQEIDLKVLFQGVAAEFCQTIETPEQVPMLVDRAVRHALATRSPACLIFPHDVQQAPAAGELPHEHGVIATSAVRHADRVAPARQDLQAAADVLNAGSRPAILVGQGARDAAAEVVRAAELLGAGVAYALLGKPVIDNTLPFVTGPTGHLGSTASYELMTGCDTLLMVGTGEPWTEFLPAPGQARAVQIDIDGRNLGSRYPTEVNLLGDAGETLRALLPLLTERRDRSWRDRVVRYGTEWRELLRSRAAEPADPVNPQAVFTELDRRLPDDVMLAVDVGSVTYWYARDLFLRPGMQASLSSTLACMGCAVPYGIAAKLARPDRPVIALAGDGAMQMLGMAEMITLARYWRDWPDPRFVILVLHNNDLNEVTWEQREKEGDPRFPASQDLPDVPYAEYARMLGFHGVEVDKPDMLGAAWDEVLAARRPALLQVRTDPAVPLLPPHQPIEQARNFYAGLAQEGEAGRAARRMLFRQQEHEERITGAGGPPRD
ncbi:pyruvate dehydrogenase (quinone) [Streptosporangium becharense]|uniref:Pyruvate dehydrogenase (Quinone) n=1 Tax=Streptosporangium becharense TaxID=1816182 RepID=A0A7W9IH40_9ACTN|nr:thiamine pyrophosphate-requiring protein [Streptosporangium becharense]MBB2912488.1 pyruvate dehydrogenase (quinone) [Streptosporangium becharense]MBB5820682.1 pyruvate dehydrogenase (quinone) [Streptosporangium becharense]